MSKIRQETTITEQFDGKTVVKQDRLEARLADLEDEEELTNLAMEIEREVKLEQLKYGTKREREEHVNDWFESHQKRLALEWEMFPVNVERYIC